MPDTSLPDPEEAVAPVPRRPRASGARGATGDSFQLDLKHRLYLLRREIGALRANASCVAEASRGEYLQALDGMERRADRLESRVDTFCSVGKGAWRSFQGDAEESWLELKQAVQRTAVSFQQSFPVGNENRSDARPRR